MSNEQLIAETRSRQIIDAYYKIIDRELDKQRYVYRVRIDDKYVLYRTSNEYVIMNSRTRKRACIRADRKNPLGRVIQLYFSQLNEEVS